MSGSRDIITFPATERAWTSRAKSHGLKDSSIHSRICDSASKISEEQYLLLRSFWVIESRPKDKPEDWGIKTISKASKWLKEYDDWQEYLQNLSSRSTKPVPRLGSFSYVFLARCQVTRLPEEYQAEDEDRNVNFSPIASRLRSSDNKPIPEERVYRESPTKAAAERKGLGQSLSKNKFAQLLQTASSDKHDKGKDTEYNISKSLEHLHIGEMSESSTGDEFLADSLYEMSPNSFRKAFPKVEDEQIVNGFLIAFLATLCMHHPEVNLEWSPVRKAFKFGKVDSPVSGDKPFLFEARTDGHLSKPELKKTDVRSAMIVEVKPTLRGYSNRVIYQATAQMAAWIYEEPDELNSQEPYRRAMILQERQEIRLVIAQYNRNYINYLRNEEGPDASVSLLEMHEFRVWDIETKGDMEEFGNILLALVLQDGKLL